MATATATPAKPPEPEPAKTSEPETPPASAAISDDASFDWGTRFRPNRNVAPDLHLGGMPTTVESVSARLDKPLPEIDPSKTVIPTANVPLEVLVQKLVDKALDDKEKSQLTYDEVFPGVPSMTPEEAEASAKADAEATKAAASSTTTEDVKP